MRNSMVVFMAMAGFSIVQTSTAHAKFVDDKNPNLLCPNRVVVVVLDPKQTDALTAKLAVISSLPFDVVHSKKISAKKEEIKITYRNHTKDDQSGSPTNPEFFMRVHGFLKDHLKELKIERMTAELLPEKGC